MGNVSLSVSILDVPPIKMEMENMTIRNRSRCSHHYAGAHCGPLAVYYHQVTVNVANTTQVSCQQSSRSALALYIALQVIITRDKVTFVENEVSTKGTSEICKVNVVRLYN